MSHFTVMVLGPDPEKQLKPFDENKRVSEYIEGPVSEEDRKRMIDHYVQHKRFRYIDNFADLYAKHGYDWNGKSWKQHTDGTWHEYSTYNPNSKWDWYEIGGRWSGMLRTTTGLKLDQALKGDIDNLDEVCTFALLKDGVWYERGKMGWFGVVIGEKDDWEGEFKKLLLDLPAETLITIIDCHI